MAALRGSSRQAQNTPRPSCGWPEGHELAARLGAMAGRSRALGLDRGDRGGRAPRPRELGSRAQLDDLLPVLGPGLTEKVSAETRSCTSSSRAGSTRAFAPRFRSCSRSRPGWRRSSPLRVAEHGRRHAPVRGQRGHGGVRARYQVLYEKMRELARREPTFALHVPWASPTPSSRCRPPTASRPCRSSSPYLRTRRGAAAAAAMASFGPRSSRAFRTQACPGTSAATRPTRRLSTSCCAPRRSPARIHLVGRAPAARFRHGRDPHRRRANDRLGDGGRRGADPGTRRLEATEVTHRPSSSAPRRCSRRTLPGGARRHRREPHRRGDRFARVRARAARAAPRGVRAAFRRSRQPRRLDELRGS